MENIWNVILNKLEDNVIIPSDNQPSKSGQYLCTCVQYWQGKEISRYLQVMEYDASHNHWHDCGRNGITHNILAWTDKIELCNFNNFEYLNGGYFLERNTEIEDLDLE